MPVIQNGVENYQDARLIAEQRDAGLVQEQLRRRGFASHEADSSSALSLTLLELPQFAAAVAALRQDSALVESAVRAQAASGLGAPGPAAGSIDDMDLVLFVLRQACREAYDGWVPALDKDQVLVQGMPYIKGAVGLPDPAPPLVIAPVTRQAGPRVAILDTEIYAHPDLVGRYLGKPVSDFGPQPPDTQGHSTFVAGLIVQRAPTAELLVRTVLNQEGENASSWDVAKNLAGVLDDEVAVVNLSLGCATADRVAPLSLRRAISALLPTVVVVASAGNNGAPSAQDAARGLTARTPVYPAAIDGVVGVGAYAGPAAGHEPAPFSPSGVPWVELVAPGVRVQSTFLSGPVKRMKLDDSGEPVEQDIQDFGQPGYATWDGTSFAAANVTGAIAALMAAHGVTADKALGMLAAQADPASDIFPA